MKILKLMVSGLVLGTICAILATIIGHYWKIGAGTAVLDGIRDASPSLISASIDYPAIIATMMLGTFLAPLSLKARPKVFRFLAMVTFAVLWMGAGSRTKDLFDLESLGYGVIGAICGMGFIDLLSKFTTSREA